MKIIIGELAHETNTFSNVKTTKELFQLYQWKKGKEIMNVYRGVRSFLGGMINRSESLGIDIVPTFSTLANPAGIITKETYQEIKCELLESIKKAGKVDAICLSLHGAGVVEEIDDLEGDILVSVRELVGHTVPLIVTLDLHGNITEKMVENSDVMLGVHYYPHIDAYDRGIEAIDVAVQIVKGEIKPEKYLTRLPLMIPTSTTNQSPAREINERCFEWEQELDVIDCTFFHGFPYTDTPDVCVSVLVTTNQNAKKAKQISKDIAKFIWQKREEFTPIILSPEKGIEKALANNNYPIIINESSDNPGGGTPGDGTRLLRAMIDAKLEKACFGFIYDPEVVNIAHRAGIGANISVELGGKTDYLHGEPIQIIAYVKALTDGKFIASTPMGKGAMVNYGKSVRLQIGGIDVIVCSIKSQVFDEQIFLLNGIDVNEYKLVALKSSQHFRAAFEQIAKEIISVDSPGLTSLQLNTFNYKRINRPIYPLDEVSWDADANKESISINNSN